jgi:RsiW-degrading membrane proteinase PrsW (M82 family)
LQRVATLLAYYRVMVYPEHCDTYLDKEGNNLAETASLRRSVWTSSMITLGGLVLFILVTAIIPQPAEQAGLVVLGIFLALVPALIWLTFFYQQDRTEPEPKRLVVRVFIFGALAAAVIPFIASFQTGLVSQTPNLLLRFGLALFTISLTQEVLKVAMVRYVVLGTNEFDRIADGIVYGLASGMGFATVLTITYIVQQQGVLPLAGGIRAVNNALVHGALGAVSGYYLGRVKIDGKNTLWMVAGLALVAVVNAVYFTISTEVSRSLSFNPWYSLIVSVLLAVIVGAVLFYFFRRALLRDTGQLLTVSEAVNARSPIMPWDIHIRYDYVLIAALALALTVGYGVDAVVEGRSRTMAASTIGATFRYPAAWSAAEAESGEWTAANLTRGGLIPPTLTVFDQKTAVDRGLEVTTLNLITALEEERVYFVELDRSTDLTVGGQPATQIVYQYATAAGGSPVIVTATETYLIVDERLLTFRYEADSRTYTEFYPAYEALLSSVELVGE